MVASAPSGQTSAPSIYLRLAPPPQVRVLGWVGCRALRPQPISARSTCPRPPHRARPHHQPVSAACRPRAASVRSTCRPRAILASVFPHTRVVACPLLAAPPLAAPRADTTTYPWWQAEALRCPARAWATSLRTPPRVAQVCRWSAVVSVCPAPAPAGFRSWLRVGFRQWVVRGFLRWAALGFLRWAALGFLRWAALGFLRWAALGCHPCLTADCLPSARAGCRWRREPVYR
jgi:hypothetical protein